MYYIRDNFLKKITEELNNNYNIKLDNNYYRCSIDIVKINNAYIRFEFSFDKNTNLLLKLIFIPSNYYTDNSSSEYDDYNEENEKIVDNILKPLNYIQSDTYIGTKYFVFTNELKLKCEVFIKKLERIIIKEIIKIFNHLYQLNNNNNQLHLFH
jgi:hypothetical protein